MIETLINIDIYLFHLINSTLTLSFFNKICSGDSEIVSLSLSGSKIVPINKTGSSDHHNKYLPHKPLHKFGTEVTVSPFPLECSFSLNTIGKQ